MFLNNPFVWKNPSSSPPRNMTTSEWDEVMMHSDSPELCPIVIPTSLQKKEEPKKFRDGSGAYIKALQKRGFKHIGSGAYSTVLGKEGSSKVIKVGRRPKEDGWWDYMTWAKNAGYMGQWAPFVYSYKYHRGYGYSGDNAFYVAVMERLESTMGGLKKGNDLAIAHRLFEWTTEYGNVKAGEIMDQFVPGLNTFAQAFRKEFADYASLDLHGGNLMVRKGGTLVVVDPLCSPKIIYKKRMKAEAPVKGANAA